MSVRELCADFELGCMQRLFDLTVAGRRRKLIRQSGAIEGEPGRNCLQQVYGFAIRFVEI